MLHNLNQGTTAPALQLDHIFQQIHPIVERHCRIYFRDIKCPHRKADLTAEAVALSFKWTVRLVARGIDPTQFPTAIARYAGRAVKSGRRVCGQEKPKDVLSPRAQQCHGFRVESLPISTRTTYDQVYAISRGQRDLDTYEERLQDNTQTPVPDQVAFRCDFPAWLKTRTSRDRRIIKQMGLGERTTDLAAHFGLSPSRVSQLRGQYRTDWERFTTDEPPTNRAL